MARSRSSSRIVSRCEQSDYVCLPVEVDASGEEISRRTWLRSSREKLASCSGFLAEKLKSCSKKCELSIDLLSVLIGCGFPCSDFTLDAGVALPSFYAMEDKTTFWLQLSIIVFAALVGGMSWIVDEAVMSRLRVPVGFKPAIILGICLVFPLFPFSVIVTALYAWSASNQDMMKGCTSCIKTVASAEVVEAVLSLALQSNAYFNTNAHGILISILASWFCTAKVVLEGNFASTTYWGITVIADNVHKDDEYFPIITGPLKNKIAEPVRSLVAFLSGLAEIASSLGCMMLFHHCAHEMLSLKGLWMFVTSMLLYVTQVVVFAFLLQRLAPFWGMRLVGSALKAPIIIDYAVLDADLCIFLLYSPKVMFQVVSLLSVFVFGDVAKLLSKHRSAWLLYGSTIASVSLWALLLLSKALAVTMTTETPEILCQQVSKGRLCREDATADGTRRRQSFARLQHSLERLLSTNKSTWCGRGLNETIGNLSIHNLWYSNDFNQSLENVTWPSSLTSITFGFYFDQSLEKVTWPSSLTSITFDKDFDQSLGTVPRACFVKFG